MNENATTEDLDEKIRLHILIDGRVQGVGFRFFTRRQALTLGITGYARNLINGKVEVVAEGKESDLEEFVKKLKRGPSMSRVTDIKIDRQKYRGEFRSFSIRYY